MGVRAPQHENGDTGLDEITSMIGNVDLTGKFRENPLDRQRQMGGKSVTKGDYTSSRATDITSKPPTWRAKPPAKPLPSTQRDAGSEVAQSASKSTSAAHSAPPPVSPLPFFSFRDFDRPPRVAYTTDADEANDLLSCLQGPILGLDLEWPMAGMYNKVDPATGKTGRVKVGMTWDAATRRYKYGQGEVALVQLCDDRLIVLVHLMNMKSRSMHAKLTAALPSKVVEIMTDPKIFKTGVQVRGESRLS